MISRRLKAKWILPVDRPPIENGLIEIVDGVITAVRAADSHDAAADDLGDVAIIPGLVNAHIHLEFSLVNQPFQPALPFTDWIRSLVAYRRQFTPDSTEPGVALNIGAIQAVMSGTTLLGDIATSNWSEIHLPIHARASSRFAS